MTESSREDGRHSDEIRPLLCVRGLLNRADGSARWCHDKTNVIAAVYGPRQAPSRRENPEKATLEVIWKPAGGQLSQEHRSAEALIARTFDPIILTSLFPRTAITIVVQVVHDDGSLISCAMNAVCAALLDASVPMSGALASITCAVAKDSGEVLIDPTAKEEKEAEGTSVLVFPSPSLTPGSSFPIERPCDDNLIASLTRGPMDVDSFFRAHEISRAACSTVSSFLRASFAHQGAGA